MASTRDPGPRTHPHLTTIPGPRQHTDGAAAPPAQLVSPDNLLDELCAQFERRFDALIGAAVETQGWALQSVAAMHGRPRFTYTVGLTAHDQHPELVIVGLRLGAAAEILNVLGEHVRDGQRLATHQQCADFPGWPRLALLDVDPDNSADLLVGANRRYRAADGPPVDALQVIWCDPAGNLPWEPGWVLPYDAQPILHYPLDPFADFDNPDDRDDGPTGDGTLAAKEDVSLLHITGAR